MQTGCLRYVVLLGWICLLSGCAAVPHSTLSVNGQEIADSLNARYVNRASDCAGRPAHECSGVMVRVFGLDSDPPISPTPDQIARNAVSFSFIRDDIPTTLLFQTGWAGMVVNTGDNAGFVRLTVRCAWPYDAYTNFRPDGCGRATGDMTPTIKSRPCAQQGIDTPEKWAAHFASLGDNKPYKYFSCGFAPTVEGFNLSIASHALIPNPEDRRRWNEILIAAWREEDVPALPIEALFFTPDTGISIGLVHVKQCAIFFATSRRIPLLRLDLEKADKKIFSFDPADQIDFDAALPTCLYRAENR
ncbi:hypothetical protein PAQ31011_04411 [Pandoraea aquatica]|uniref:Halovibrin HvnA n=1 Tax=Pandoraea aquatica TaxID=2508290 RepID=A0A5E4YB53_9BURK|nr:hypothetical protein [Pandoraea aquatica]VVE45647.1 hypothetical protein PAQ31011_04411 [Pandoraea aquatica]